MILDNIPRIRLLDQPTPLQRMPRIENLTGHNSLWVKRDDAIPLGQGGNKIRSLEFWLGEAVAQSSDILLVAGKAVSNLTRATAAAAAKLGLECLIIHNDDRPQRFEGNLLLSHLFGASFEFIGPVDEDARAAMVEETAKKLRREGRKPYIIGGSTTGALGYVTAALELHQQAEEIGNGLKHVLLPGSMGTTEAGFLFGCALLGRPFMVHLISIEYSTEEMKQRIATIYQGISERLNIQPSTDYLEWTRFYEDYLGPGYDQPTPASLAAIHTFGAHEGLLVENTYTSKPAAALLDLIQKEELPKNEPACFLHTGGVPAIFSQADLFVPPS